MRLDNINNNNKDDDKDELYMKIYNNIDNILGNDDIKNMLDPKSNSTTREFLKVYEKKVAYSLSYFMTVLLILQIST